MAKKKWDSIFSPYESLKKAMKEYKDLEGITFEIRLKIYESKKEIKYKIVYDAADVKKVKFRELPTFMEVTLIDGTVNEYTDCSYALVYDYERYHKIETVKELKEEADRLGYNIIKKSESEKLLPCVCGCNQRSHLFNPEFKILKCKRCGLEAFVNKNASEIELKKEWNRTVKTLGSIEEAEKKGKY